MEPNVLAHESVCAWSLRLHVVQPASAAPEQHVSSAQFLTGPQTYI